MKLGAFSISLAVKDLEASQAFYEKLGFTLFAGEKEHNYLIMKNEDKIIGLFQGMFDQNIMTLNPGWDQDCNTLESFDDVRSIHETLKSNGIQSEQVVLDNPEGPGSFVITDPDGNAILIDQHI